MATNKFTELSDMALLAPMFPTIDWHRVLARGGLYEAALRGKASDALQACIEVARRVSESQNTSPRLTTPNDIADFVRPHLTSAHEHFMVIALDSRMQVLHYKLFEGSSDQCVVDPRKVFASVLPFEPSAMVVAHNHPSGDPTPSLLDMQLTKQLRDGAHTLNIRFIDHIIIGAGRYYSFVTYDQLGAAK